MLAVTALALLKLRNLFAVAMLAGIYSLLSAILFTALDAVDVAFTEAAVGAGISTILVLGTLALVGHEQKKNTRSSVLPLLVVFVTGSILVYGTLDMPPYGNPDNPVHQHVAPHYLVESEHEIGIPNVVTSILASYRGYDTMGETTVIFTAMVGVLLLMDGVRKRKGNVDPPGPYVALENEPRVGNVDPPGPHEALENEPRVGNVDPAEEGDTHGG